MNFAWHCHFSSDPKAAAQKFCRLNISSTHHVDDIKDGGSTSAMCTQHHSKCDLAVQDLDIYIVGFPCKPFTTYRAGRTTFGGGCPSKSNDDVSAPPTCFS
jgi:hypothetical protein